MQYVRYYYRHALSPKIPDRTTGNAVFGFEMLGNLGIITIVTSTIFPRQYKSNAMNWKDTLGNIKANYSQKHLEKYSAKEQKNIKRVTAWITLKAAMIGVMNQIIFRMPKQNRFENESTPFKAWFCRVWASEVMKR